MKKINLNQGHFWLAMSLVFLALAFSGCNSSDVQMSSGGGPGASPSPAPHTFTGCAWDYMMKTGPAYYGQPQNTLHEYGCENNQYHISFYTNGQGYLTHPIAPGFISFNYTIDSNSCVLTANQIGQNGHYLTLSEPNTDQDGYLINFRMKRFDLNTTAQIEDIVLSPCEYQHQMAFGSF